THDCANSSRELRKREWLRDVIICTSIQAADAFFHAGSARHYQHGKLRLFGTDTTENVEARRAWQRKVQQHQIVRLLRGHALGFPSISDYLNREILLLQPLMQKFSQRRVIFSDKNAHRPHTAGWIFEGVRPVLREESKVSRPGERAVLK